MNRTLSPTILNYDTSLMTQTGIAYGRAAGTYRMVFKLNDTENYHWEDGTTSVKTLVWKINPAVFRIARTSINSSTGKGTIYVFNPDGLNLGKVWSLSVSATPTNLFSASLLNESIGTTQSTVQVAITKKTSTTTKNSGTLKITFQYTGSDGSIDSTPITSSQSFVY